MSFKPKECAIPTVWCGKGNPPSRKRSGDVYYYKTGSRYECMQKGFGSGMYSEKSKLLPEYSLQHIKYVGETYEKRFKSKGVNDTVQLITFVRDQSVEEIEGLLSRIFAKKGGGIDKRAYNSTLMYLYHNGNHLLPKCHKINPKDL